MNKYLKIDQCLISFDSESNCFRITSKDEKLKGKPFQITLPINTKKESYTVKTLFDLLLESGDSEVIDKRLPEKIPFPDRKKRREIYEKIGVNEEVAPVIGETFGREEVFFNLTAGKDTGVIGELSPHTFVLGRHGSGKISLLHSIVKNAELSQVSSQILDLKNYTFFPPQLKKGHLDISSGLMESYDKLVEVEKVIYQRYKILKERGEYLYTALDKTTFSHVDSFDTLPIYLIIDEISEVFQQPQWFRDAFMSKVAEILRIGRAAGVFVFIFDQHFKGFYKHFGAPMVDIERRVLMGDWRDYRIDDVRSFLQIDAHIGVDKKLLSHGRGVVSVSGDTPVLFQIYSDPTFSSLIIPQK